MNLTKLEKAKNAAAKKVKDRAYKERVNLYRKAMNAIHSLPHIQSLKEKMDEADVIHHNAINERNKKINELREKILELQKQIDDLYSVNYMEKENKHQRDSGIEYRNALYIEEQLVASAFPDLINGPSLSYIKDWVPPQDVSNQMEEARRAVKLDEN